MDNSANISVINTNQNPELYNTWHEESALKRGDLQERSSYEPSP